MKPWEKRQQKIDFCRLLLALMFACPMTLWAAPPSNQQPAALFDVRALTENRARLVLESGWGSLREGKWSEAESYALEALQLGEQLGNAKIMWSARASLFGLYSSSSSFRNLDLAIQHGQVAIDGFQAIAATLAGLHDFPQGSNLQTNAEVYESLASALIEAERFAEAEQVLYMLKERELAELLKSSDIPTNSRSRDVVGVARKANSLRQLVMQYDLNAIGLQYVMTDTHLSILVSTSKGAFGRKHAISRAELNHLVSSLRTAIVNRLDTQGPAKALWNALIAPVHDLIAEAAPKTLVLGLTGRLRYLPFAALQNPKGQYLVEAHALVNWASVGNTVFATRSPSLKIDGLGLTQARMGQSALPSVKSELTSIVRSQESPRGLLPGRLAMDEQFDQARFIQALEGQAKVVHVASHFNFKPGDEQQSVLMLGKGAPLSLASLSKLDYSLVELLTLSACNTATGGGLNEHGAEVEGLAAAVLRKNARAVLASLWKVSDQSTAELMRSFYAARGGNGAVGQAAALRKAQLSLIGNKQGNYSHPFFWAPFVLNGNWN